MSPRSKKDRRASGYAAAQKALSEINADRVARGVCRHCGGPVPCWSPFGDVKVGVRNGERSAVRPLRRIRAGRYATRDGGIEFVRDPQFGGWLVYYAGRDDAIDSHDTLEDAVHHEEIRLGRESENTG